MGAIIRLSNRPSPLNLENGFSFRCILLIMGPRKPPTYPPRRNSAASENDFFDIPDEPCLAILKRQLRRIRTWVVFALFILFFLWLRREPPKPPPLPHIRYDLVDWSRYAYFQYATSGVYLCNAVMIFEALHRLGSRAERVLFYPEQMDTSVESESDRDSQLLLLAKEKYNVQITPIDIQSIKGDSGTCRKSESSPSILQIPEADRTGIGIQARLTPGIIAFRNSLPSVRYSTSA